MSLLIYFIPQVSRLYDTQYSYTVILSAIPQVSRLYDTQCSYTVILSAIPQVSRLYDTQCSYTVILSAIQSEKQNDIGYSQTNTYFYHKYMNNTSGVRGHVLA